MNDAVGFIGLGRMGQAICQRLMNSRVPIHLYNRTQEKSLDLVRQGAVWVPDMASLAGMVRVVFVCTTGSEAQHEIYHSPRKGLLSNMVAGSTVVDLSTVAPESAVALHASFRAQGVDYIESPVSGGVEGALNGTLSAIVSARPAAYERVYPLLGTFCEAVTYVERPGKAQRLKILNNLAESINLAGAIEVISQGAALGLDLKSLADVFTSCRGRSAYMQVALDYALSDGASSNVSLATRCKDLDLAQAQLPVGQRYPVSSMAMEVFHRVRRSCGDEGDQCQYFSLLSYNNARSTL